MGVTKLLTQACTIPPSSLLPPFPSPNLQLHPISHNNVVGKGHFNMWREKGRERPGWSKSQPQPVVENSMKREGGKLSQRRIGHPSMRKIKLVWWIPRAVQSGGGRSRIGHLTCARVPKSCGKKLEFWSSKKCGRDSLRQLKWRDNTSLHKIQCANQFFLLGVLLHERSFPCELFDISTW